MTFSSIVALFSAMVVLAFIPSVSVLAVSTRSATSGFIHGVFTTLGIVVGDIIFIIKEVCIAPNHFSINSCFFSYDYSHFLLHFAFSFIKRPRSRKWWTGTWFHFLNIFHCVTIFQYFRRKVDKKELKNGFIYLFYNSFAVQLCRFNKKGLF